MPARVTRRGAWLVRWLWAWLLSHRWLVLAWSVASVVAAWVRSEPVWAWAGAGLVWPLGLAAWAWRWPVGYEQVVAGPSRRRGWRRYVRRNWTELAEACGWTRATHATRVRFDGRRERTTSVSCPRLRKVRTSGSTVSLVVRARPGQTLEGLEAGVPALAATVDALSFRCTAHRWSASTVLVELVMHDALRGAREGTVPEKSPVGEPGYALPLGRRDVGGGWALTVAGRHTLTAGCSGSGKGSVLWGTVAGLAPWVPSDTVRLWGIDLKHGVELHMGRALFTTVADTGPDAVNVLESLLRVAEARGAAMAGQVRAHTPTPGDPLHVLIVDELADLIAYADRDTRMEAARLLARLLTKGRALGVVVVAFVQDPRKDVVAMRNLFTQRVALRLLSDQEAVMVLGDSAARTAPAHRIAATAPGTAWVVDDAGNADRVRADYWPDPVIRDLASRFPCAVRPGLLPQDSASVDPDEDEMAEDGLASGGDDGPVLRSVPDLSDPRTVRPRRPRSPRTPRSKAAATTVHSASAPDSGGQP